MTCALPLSGLEAWTAWCSRSGSDLFILALPDRRIVAFHVTKPGWPPEAAERDLKRSVEQGGDASWWYDNGLLYEIFLQTITAGTGPRSRALGFLAIGYHMVSTVADHVAPSCLGRCRSIVFRDPLPSRWTVSFPEFARWRRETTHTPSHRRVPRKWLN